MNVAHMGWSMEGIAFIYAIPAATLLDVVFLAKAISEQLGQMQKDLAEQRARALVHSRFTTLGKTIGLIVHQWRAPLARQGALLTELSIMRQHASPAMLSQQLESDWLPRMQQNLDQLDQTIRDFRNYFMPNQPVGLFDPIDVIDRSCALMACQQTLPGLRIDWMPPKGRIAMVGEPAGLAHVLMIVFENALDAFVSRTVSSPSIVIDCTYSAGMVTIRVCDNAGGIRITPIESIFEGFVSDGREGASGMGLFFARMIVESRMRGRIDAHNTADGACLRISGKGSSGGDEV